MNSLYNPFKMCGSYIGLIIGITILPDAFSKLIDNVLPSQTPMIIISLWVGGFLAGWGIHSLFRRYN